MKKLFNLILFVVTSLLLLSCEKEKYPGAYPFDHVVFYGDTLITEGDSARVLFLDYNNWNKDLYPMQLWVDNEEIATISSSGYLTAKKEGTVTIHAKVMSIYGEIESRIKYTVRDFLKEYIKNNQRTLKYLGLDIDNDGSVTVSDIKQAEKISEFIDSDMLLVLAPYMPNLKEASVVADTTSRTLDLSMLKLKKVSITDRCFNIAVDDNGGAYSSVSDYEKYKDYFLTEFILNNEVESLEIHYLPNIRNLDLRKYSHLKQVVRKVSEYVPSEWIDMDIILPTNIENIELYRTKLIINDIYPQMEKIRLVYNESIQPRIEINKVQFPKLKHLYLKEYIYFFKYIDISTYNSTDLEYVYARADTIILSESMYTKEFLTRNELFSTNYIVK
jgi:hypothetical protein